MIDLRSDTVTTPTEAMRQAMAYAPVGDDVYGEDPTVNELQDYVADLLGKEAALFVPTGVMGNQICIKLHTHSGDEVIVDSESHVFHYETGAPAIISQVQLHCVRSANGIFDPQELRDAVRPPQYYFPRTSLFCMENTHNRYSGRVIPLDHILQCREIAREFNLAFHCDGARLWNACAATGLSPAEYAAPFDTLSVCLSKALGAPAGSVIVGKREHIDHARKWRKILGGGMRQAGVLAAAGLHALRQHRELLIQDHYHAQIFAGILDDSALLQVNPEDIHSNIVVFRYPENIPFVALATACEEQGVLISAGRTGHARAVFHFQISEEDARRAGVVIVEAIERSIPTEN